MEKQVNSRSKGRRHFRSDGVFGETLGLFWVKAVSRTGQGSKVILCEGLERWRENADLWAFSPSKGSTSPDHRRQVALSDARLRGAQKVEGPDTRSQGRPNPRAAESRGRKKEGSSNFLHKFVDARRIRKPGDVINGTNVGHDLTDSSAGKTRAGLPTFDFFGGGFEPTLAALVVALLGKVLFGVLEAIGRAELDGLAEPWAEPSSPAFEEAGLEVDVVLHVAKKSVLGTAAIVFFVIGIHAAL